MEARGDHSNVGAMRIKKLDPKSPQIKEEYEKMKLYYKQSYSQNLKNRVLNKSADYSHAAGRKVNASDRSILIKERQGCTDTRVYTDKLQSEATRPFTVDMPIKTYVRSPKQTTMNLNPLSGNRAMAASEIAKAAALALDKHCPRMELPDLYCFHADFSPKTESEEEAAERQRRKSTDDLNRAKVGQLRQMRQLAIAHASATSRIATKADLVDGLAPLSFHSCVIGDLVDVEALFKPPSAKTGTEKKQQNHYGTSLNAVEDDMLPAGEKSSYQTQMELLFSETALSWPAGQFTPIQEEVEDERGENRDGDEHDGQAEQQTDAVLSMSIYGGALGESSGTAVKKLALPLDLRAVAGQGRIMESKAPSELWSNYLSAGKSKFAKV